MVLGVFQLSSPQVEAPTVVHRHAAFPSASRFPHAVISCSGVEKSTFQAVAIVQDNFRLEFENHFVHASRFPLLRGRWPVRRHTRGRRSCRSSSESRISPCVYSTKRLRAASSVLQARAVGMVPVHERIIEADAQPFGPGGINKFADQIPPRALRGHVSSVSFVSHGKSPRDAWSSSPYISGRHAAPVGPIRGRRWAWDGSFSPAARIAELESLRLPAHSCWPITLYRPQWMNMPNLASCHHAILCARVRGFFTLRRRFLARLALFPGF